MIEIDWHKVKRQQAREADSLAGVASGIGEYGIANACFRLAAILRRQAELSRGKLPRFCYVEITRRI